MKFTDLAGDFSKRLDAAADRAKTRLGLQLSGEVKKSMRARGSGTVMRTDSKGRTRLVRMKHLPSNPGETPAVQSGKYRATIDHTMTKGVTGYLRIGTPDKRGVWLEKGTSTIAPRPHLEPVTMAHSQDLQRAFAEELGRL